MSVGISGKEPAPGAKAGAGSCVIIGRVGQGRGGGRGGGVEAEVALGVFWTCSGFIFGFAFGLDWEFDCGFEGLRLSSLSSTSEVTSYDGVTVSGCAVVF